MSIIEHNEVVTDVEVNVQRLRLDTIDPDPNNRNAPVDKDMVASVRTHGVIEPILVRPSADHAGRFQIVAGERRYRAAILAERDSIDAIVRELDDQAAAEVQIIENLHRRDLLPTQEAGAMFRLVEMGMTQKELAKRIGKSAKYVSNRLRLLELPSKARKQLDDGKLTVEEAVALCGLVDHPERLDAIVSGEPDYRDVEGEVRAAHREIERNAAVDERTKILEAQGLRIVAHDSNTRERGYVEIGGWSGLDIDADEHRSEDCHAAVVHPYRPDDVIEVCTDRSRHQSKGDSAIKVQSRNQANGRSEEEKALRKARSDADAQRQAFMAEIVQGTFRKAEALAFVMGSYLDAANAQSCAVACKLLGLNSESSSSPWERKNALATYAQGSARNLLRATVAVAAAQGDGEVRNGFSPSRKVALYAWLKAEGYVPSEYEATLLGEDETANDDDSETTDASE